MGRKEFEEYKIECKKRLEVLEDLFKNKSNHLQTNIDVINQSNQIHKNLNTCYEVSRFYDEKDPICSICGMGGKQSSMKSCAKNPLINRYRIG